MKLLPYAFLLLIGISYPAASVVGDEIDFDRDIKPILADKCFRCHGPDEATREAELRLDSFEGATRDLGGYAAITPSEPDNSHLLDRIIDEVDPMPPLESNLSLTDQEIDLLRAWIDSGASYKQHWAFVAPTRPDIPTSEFGPNPIDAFIGRRLAEEGLSFSPEASPERLIRRVTLDLTGLPPTLAEIDAFLEAYSHDREQAWEALVDRLLESPRYGETMALPWLDAARFADTDGYQYDGPRHQWRWRDWVINAYNSNMPFDQFTIEQIAGDLLPNATLDQQIATGFNRNHRYNSEAGLVVEEFLLENAVDRVDTTSTLWMGLTIGCARCHDHKYDPFSQREYYQLISFFNSVPEAGRAIKSGNSEPTIIAPTEEQQEILATKIDAYHEAHDYIKTVQFANALRPEPITDPTQPLIDRKLIHRYLLDELPAEHATPRGEPVFDQGHLQLDGESTLELAGQNKGLTLKANSTFSISFWLRPDEIRESVILSRQNPGTTRPGIEVAMLDDGRLQFDLVTRWVAGNGRATTKVAIEPQRWVHVTITNDASQSANGQWIYFDGQRIETDVTHNTNSNVGGVNVNRPIIVGGGVRPGSDRFAGAIRDLRFYQSRLWPEEIQILAAPDDAPERLAFAKTKTDEAYGKYVELREDLERYRKTLPTVMVMRESPEPKPTFIRKRGVYNDFGDQVQRDVPTTLPMMEESLPRNRLGFAEWLVSPEHPLTARVAVNRYWQKFFGTGLVRTAEDFGVQGEPPSHPELLDWMATEFVDREWNVAEMIKLIVSSRTYRQRSQTTSELLEQDPDNRLLARGPRLRLTGHALRDQALFSSGLLVESIGGPSVSPYQPANMWAEMSMGMKYKQSKGDDLYRRSLYTIWKRTVAPPAMAVFDAADREACWVRRRQTNTPLQALTLMNETGFVESARHLAYRMMTEGSSSPVEFGFRTVTSRYPQEREEQILDEALEEFRAEFSSFPEDARTLIAVGESPTPTDVDPVELAAYTALANLLLNLDEVITRE